MRGFYRGLSRTAFGWFGRLESNHRSIPRKHSAGRPRRGGMERRVEAATVEGFVQQLAVAYVARGYYFYVTGLVPEGKDPARVDAKLCARYGVGLSKWARARRRAAGQASHAYIRYRRFFVLLATHGESPFFDRGGRGPFATRGGRPSGSPGTRSATGAGTSTCGSTGRSTWG